MGCVYKAYDAKLERFVALKIISNELAGKLEIERFLREAKTTASLHHPHIVAVYDIGTEQKKPYFTMDLINGVSLKEFLQKTSGNIRRCIGVMVKIVNAIDYAHDKGVIHREIKPSNVMITEEKEPKIMDFGLAKVLSSSEQISKTGEILV